MRAFSCLAAAAAAVTLIVAAAPAEAQQSRRAPLSVTVEGRSWLDAGKVAPVGSYNRHLQAANRAGFTGPNFNQGSWYGSGTLPDHIGAGANPFANTIWTPGWR
jgi:hypothetical protein